MPNHGPTFTELIVIAVIAAGMGFWVGYNVEGSKAQRWHAEVCELRLASAADASDSLRVVQDDVFCLEERE